MTAKLRFRKWLSLEAHREQLTKAAESSDFPDKVFAYLSVAFDEYPNKPEPWENTVFSLLEGMRLQPDKSLPFIKDAPKGQDGKPADWDYEGREWAYWSHLLAKHYGWTLEYIGGLDVNEALARIQEILTDEQLEREFYYGLSEIAYPYNKSTKKNHFKPLSRPYWMRPAVPKLKTVKFRRDMLPVGLVQDISGMPDEYNPIKDAVKNAQKNAQSIQKKTETEKTDAPPNP